MNFGYREVCLDHDTGPRHPESADRLRAIRRRLAESHDVDYVAPPDADEELVRRVHDTDYVDEFKQFCEHGGGDWDADTVAVEETWDAALASAGIAVWAATEALDGASGHATPFSLGRPPGHHAVEGDAMGFCFLNNAVVGAQAALDSGADRVAIVDWDVHHGNGGQDICYRRGDIFNVSLHESGLYPGTGEIEETGENAGDMCNLNVPFPPGTDTVGYLTAFDEVILPTLREYDPDLVLVSAGFDAHQHDPISRMRITTEGYGLMTERLSVLVEDCGAGLGFVLEGGYSLDTLADSIATVNKTVAGYDPQPPRGGVSEDARAVLDDLLAQGFGSK